MHVKKGDKVKVITGKDKGKSGVIIHALPKEERVVIEGVGMYKRHTKGRTGQVGRIVERPRAIHASNVVLMSTPKIASALDAPAKKAAKPAKKSAKK